MLRRIARAEDEELVYEQGAGWWIDTAEVSGKVANELLRFCLVHAEHEHGAAFERYTVNEEGRALLADASYEPKIREALRSRRL